MAAAGLAFACAPAASAAAAERAADWVAAQGGSPRLAQRAALVVEEILANIASHGDAPAGSEVAVRLAHDGESLRIETEDEGRPFDPREAPAPDVSAAIEERPVGGLGLHLIRSLASDIAYRRAGARNLLRVTLRWEA